MEKKAVIFAASVSASVEIEKILKPRFNEDRFSSNISWHESTYEFLNDPVWENGNVTQIIVSEDALIDGSFYIQFREKIIKSGKNVELIPSFSNRQKAFKDDVRRRIQKLREAMLQKKE